MRRRRWRERHFGSFRARNDGVRRALCVCVYNNTPRRYTCVTYLSVERYETYKSECTRLIYIINIRRARRSDFTRIIVSYPTDAGARGGGGWRSFPRGFIVVADVSPRGYRRTAPLLLCVYGGGLRRRYSSARDYRSGDRRLPPRPRICLNIKN